MTGHPHRDCIYFKYKIVYGGSAILCLCPDVKEGMWSGGAGESDCRWGKCRYYSKTGKTLKQLVIE